MVLSMIYDPINPEDALRMAKSDIINVNANLIEKQKSASKSGYSVDLINPELKSAAEEANNLRSDLTEKSQKLFYQTFVIVHLRIPRRSWIPIPRPFRALAVGIWWILSL